MPLLRLMATRHSAFYSPFICAVEGFLAAEGIDSTYLVAGPGDTFRSAVLGGRTDVMQSAVSASWRDLARGENALPVHFAQINRSDGFLLTARQPDPEFQWPKLEGRVVLADHGAQPLAMLRYAVARHGVEWSRIRVVDAGSPERMEQAFRSGEGDYIHLQAPAPQTLQSQGVGSVVAWVGERLPPCAFSSICASRDFLEGPAFTPFLRAFSKAKQWVQTAPAADVAAREAGWFPGVDRAALEAAVAGYQQLGTWLGDARIPAAHYEQSLDIFASSGELPKRYPYGEICKESIP